jgi:hypothetical protein
MIQPLLKVSLQPRKTTVAGVEVTCFVNIYIFPVAGKIFKMRWKGGAF